VRPRGEVSEAPAAAWSGRLRLAEPREGPAVADEETVAALVAGNESALRRAYREHHAEVRLLARRLVGERGAAEDLVQEVFVRLPQAARRFRGAGSLRGFLLAMAINHARHHVRAAARRRAATDRLAREMEGRSSCAPEDQVERQQTARALMRALDTLPLDQRVAFILCEVEERTSADAARLVGTSDGTLRARLHHAKRKLRVALFEQGYGEGDGR
jgi:RNA polymerase sigma-70 factor, ECF subfamily